MDEKMRFDRLKEMKDALQGSPERVEKQHKEGKGLARERAGKLFDQGSFMELDAFDTEAALLAGFGLLRDRPVYLLAQDITFKGGAMGAAQARKMVKALDLAQKTGAPVLLILDSEGMLVSKGAESMAACARVAAKLSELSGHCPLIALIAGPCLGSALGLAQLCDISIAVENSAKMFLHSPLVQNSVNGTALDDKALGGAQAMSAQGALSLVVNNEDEAFSLVGQILDLLPAFAYEASPFEDNDDLNRMVDPSIALAPQIMDAGQGIELYPEYGKGIKTFLTRVGGRACGINALQGKRMESADCEKAARFIRFCDCFGLPILTLIDTEGLAVAEQGGQGALMRAFAKLQFAYARSKTLKLAVIHGNAIGAAYVAFVGKEMAEMSFAWPNAMIAPLTREAAVQTFAAERLKDEEREALEAEFAQNADGFAAAKAGLVDDVIAPAETRQRLIAAMELLADSLEDNSFANHGNMPL